MRPAETSSFAARRTSASGIAGDSSLIHVNLGELLQSRNTKVRFGETPKPARETRALPIHVNFGAFLGEFLRLCFQSGFERFAFFNPLLCRVLSDVLSNSHGTKVRTTHRTKMGGLCALLRKRLVMELACSLR